MLPLTAYADRFSVQPGEAIEFKVSSQGDVPYRARLVRVISGDPNPDGPGILERVVPSTIDGEYLGREQAVQLGSYALVPDHDAMRNLKTFTAAALIWPTLPGGIEQTIISRHDTQTGTGFSLSISENGDICGVVGDGSGRRHSIITGKPLRRRCWYLVWLAFDAGGSRLSAGHQPLFPTYGIDDEAQVILDVPASCSNDFSCDLTIAGSLSPTPNRHYNGKIESPMLLSRASSPKQILQFAMGGKRPRGLLAHWDFSRGISTTKIDDVGPNKLNGTLINLPARAMKGARWDGTEMSWRHMPEHYGAIHFHDDDIYDCGWDTDFRLDVPTSLKSGVYAVKLEREDRAYDMVPFFVRPAANQPKARICLLMPTFTYTIYGNHQRGNTDSAYRTRARTWNARPWTPDDHPDYGLSTYNVHHDGSGICHASRLRPMISMRSGYLTFVDQAGSGLRHFPADTHLLAWLNAKGFEVDIITDEDLDEEGADLLAPYSVVVTGSHPEYHTRQTLDALTEFTQTGGRLMYLGGNGFYWRVARHSELPGVVEIRRGEGGIRAWASEPGEYYNAFDGQYGGLWRRNGRPPQRLTGVGFSAQGVFEGSGYKRNTLLDRSTLAWIFDGVTQDVIGDFGLSGGGAAGFELDRIDDYLGSPANAIVVATSEGKHGLGPKSKWVVVPEEILTHLSTSSGESKFSLVRADMVYMDCPHGGAIFSVGSITYCGSLPYANFNSTLR